jgi:hypothetical protein
MGSNLIDVVINQLVGVVIGTVVSFIMSWYFYKKADFLSSVTADMTENVLFMLIQDRLGVNFGLQETVPHAHLPKDLDVPHFTRFWLSTRKVKPGDSFLVLFRVEDKGLNFPGPENAEVTESESKVSFPLTRQGHGYYSCKVNCPSHATPGLHTLTIKLTDSKGKSHVQTIRFAVAR